ncbi:MAG: rod shape-determining protein RodA [Tannerella sp.]|jgi:rod shape determining protein RodA|nr:rod shape-determining protein RodA [Tannerella sp.]
MKNDSLAQWRTVDWLTVSLYCLMVAAGWISICGASYDFENPTFFSPSARPGMQLIWIGISSMLIFVIMMMDKHFFETFAYIIYWFLIALLILTVFVAPDIKGSHSWLVITSSIRLQPAEFAKFATVLALAKRMNNYNFNLLTARNFLSSLIIIMLPAVCIIMQNETGSALVFIALAIVLYREGMSGYVLLTGICAVLFFIIELKYEATIWQATPAGELIVTSIILLMIIFMLRFIFKARVIATYFTYIIIAAAIIGYVSTYFITFNLVLLTLSMIAGFVLYLLFYSLKKYVVHYALIAVFAVMSVGFLYSIDYVFDNVLEPHQRERIMVSLGMIDDPAGKGYNVNQSKIAIGSGGFVGKGFLNGTQTKLKYVPEQDTDFIFCTVGEEFGFLGAIFVIALYCTFLLRLMHLAERQDTVFGRVYGYGIMSIIFFHVLVNIGMVCGIMPVIGIPLPFFSYGGSSLLGFTIMLFIFLRIDSGRKER